MKNKIILILLSAAAIGLGFLFFQNLYQPHIIFLKDNAEVRADDVWTIGDNVLYQCNNEFKSIAMPDVLHIKQGGTFDAESGFILAKHLWTSYKKKVSSLLSGRNFENPALKKWSFILGAALLLILGCWLAVIKLKHTYSARTPGKKKKKDANAKHLPQEESTYQGREAIVQFFLQIFKLQKGAAEEDEALFRRLDNPTPDGNYTYELRVKREDDWTSRRMTIGSIGEESGSRSTCYFVIYDDHLVVKIPPHPVTKFDKYIQSIKRDGVIAEKLQPRECLVPRISPILKKIHPFYEDQQLPIEKIEDKYIDWLKTNDEYQAYLKIGDSFAYFMDLSRYFFLGGILRKMHALTSRMAEEVSNQPGILWDTLEFEARYGQQHVLIADNLHSVYTSFENRVKSVLQQSSLSGEISSFQIKEWFLKYLSGESLSASDIDAAPGIAFDLNAAVKRLLREKEAPVEQYRQMIRAYTVGKSLQQDKGRLSGLITNLLDLLAWLNEKKIAVRDLKPDNLLVAGDPSKYPQFLESATQYSIGLIDLETAVSFDADDMKKIKQPPLGGTPAYSTLTHVLRNDILTTAFRDLPMILHLQDWYAAIGMIYEVATGEKLFVRTAKTLLKLKAAAKDHSKKEENPLKIMEDASRTFWREASREFESKVLENEKRLDYIDIIATRESKTLLVRLISGTQDLLSKDMRRILVSQRIFKGDKAKKRLYSAPYLKLKRFKTKLMEETAKKLQPEEGQTAARVLDELIYSKKQSAQLLSAAAALQKPVAIISAHALLKAVFVIVLVHMHQRKWGTVIS
jgi:serine/threonine protein kinase